MYTVIKNKTRYASRLSVSLNEDENSSIHLHEELKKIVDIIHRDLRIVSKSYETGFIVLRKKQHIEKFTLLHKALILDKLDKSRLEQILTDLMVNHKSNSSKGILIWTIEFYASNSPF